MFAPNQKRLAEGDFAYDFPRRRKVSPHNCTENPLNSYGQKTGSKDQPVGKGRDPSIGFKEK